MSEPSPAHRNQYALAALKDARALAAGELAQIKSQYRLKQEALAHIDFVLRFFAPDVDPEAIPSRRHRKDNPYPVPHLNRMLLTILRRRGEPMLCPEVVDAVIARRNCRRRRCPSSEAGSVRRCATWPRGTGGPW